MKNAPFIAVSVLLLVLFFSFGFVMERENFSLLVLGFAVLFIAFGGWCFMARKATASQVLLLAIGVRLAMVFSQPVLSDDAYRFVWDGRLILAGHNPMEYLPTDAIDLPDAEEAGLTHALFMQLNSKDYYTVYPPLHQAFFAAGVAASPNSVVKSITAMRLLLLAVEVLGLLALVRVLKRFNHGPPALALYALNPLVVVEGVGNLHFEVAVVGFLAMALWATLQEKAWRWWLSGAFFGLAVLLKLTPLLLAPLLLVAVPVRRWGAFFGAAAVLQAVAWWFFLSTEVLDHFSSSLDLYFRRFEFNASLYYLARALGEGIYGYNAIASVGPLMALAAFLGILAVAVGFRLRRMRGFNPSIAEAAVLSWLFYLACATTVHPWYAIVPLAMAVFTRYRAALLAWSFTIFLSYAHYRDGLFSEHFALIAASYLIPVIVHFFWRSKQATTLSQ